MDSGNLVLATTPKSFVSKCIRWFTKSNFSHSFVTMPDVLGVSTCIEASEGGVDIGRFDNLYSNNKEETYEIWTLNLPQNVKEKAIVSTMDYLETGYGFLEYPWFMWRKLNLLFGKDIKSQNNWNTDGMICSQLCVSYLKSCGLSYIFIGYGNGSVSPQDLRNIFLLHPELFTIAAEVKP